MKRAVVGLVVLAALAVAGCSNEGNVTPSERRLATASPLSSPDGGAAAASAPTPGLQGATSTATTTEGAPSVGGGDADPCVEAMVVAAGEMRDNFDTGTENEAAIIATVTVCTTVEDWVAALRQYPLAMGLDAGSAIDPGIELSGLCDNNDAPVCADARDRGLNTYWH